MDKISKSDARNFLIAYHHLNGDDEWEGKQGVLQYFKRVGSIQYDPLNVVGKNADLVLQSRIKNYEPEILNHLLYKERILVDGWDKMMSIYQLEDWPYFKRIRNEKKKEIKNVLERRNSLGALELTDEIKKKIKEKGPLQASDVKIGESKTGRWGHKKLSSATLDYLFNIGELGIYDKRNTQKIYDVVENLYSEELVHKKDAFKNDDEFYKWYIKRRIGSVGLLWERNGGGWLGHFVSNTKLRQRILNELVEDKELITVQVEDINSPFYLRKEDKHFFANNRNDNIAKFIAPLDNLLWDRKMIESLFNFNYSWEVYVPKNKRKYGYYVLPVLYKNQLIARFEPELHRNNEIFKIKNWWWEERILINKEIKDAIDTALINFSQYLGASAADKKVNQIIFNH